MTQKIVVAYDGSASGKAALAFALETAQAMGGSLIIAHVLDWSPYSFLTPSEVEERHKRREEELARAKTAVLDPVLAELKDSGVEVTTALKYGHIADTLCRIAKDEGANRIVVGRVGRSSSISSRLFGSVASSLAQSAPVPVTIVP